MSRRGDGAGSRPCTVCIARQGVGRLLRREARGDVPVVNESKTEGVHSEEGPRARQVRRGVI